MLQIKLDERLNESQLLDLINIWLRVKILIRRNNLLIYLYGYLFNFFISVKRLNINKNLIFIYL